MSKQILGKVNKSVGDLTFSKWKTKAVVKGKASEVSNPRTPGQIAARAKFSQMSKSAQSLGDVIRLGMKPLATDQTEYNAWMKLNYPNWSADGENITLNVKLINKVATEKGMSLPVPAVNSPGAGEIEVVIPAVPANTYPFAPKACVAVAGPENTFLEIVGAEANIDLDAQATVNFDSLPAGTYVVYVFTYGNNGAFTSESVATQVVVA